MVGNKQIIKEGMTDIPQMMVIEDLQDKHEVTDAEMEGMKAANRWRAGYQMTEDIFLAAYRAFMEAPVGRKGIEK